MLKKIWMVCVLLMPISLFAVELEALYSYEMPVQGQSAQERSQVVKKALAGVLEKVSGDPAVVDSSQFSTVYMRADSFVLRYRYLPLTDELLWDDGYRQILRVDFDEEAVRQLLKQSGFSALGDLPFATLVRLTVTKVSSIEDYARVTHYLHSLGEVTHVQVEEVDREKIVLRLNIQGDVAGLAHSIDLGDTMTQVGAHYLTGYYGVMPSDLSEEDAELTYRLIE